MRSPSSRGIHFLPSPAGAIARPERQPVEPHARGVLSLLMIARRLFVAGHVQGQTIPARGAFEPQAEGLGMVGVKVPDGDVGDLMGDFGAGSHGTQSPGTYIWKFSPR